jgi:acyl carrier protein
MSEPIPVSITVLPDSTVDSLRKIIVREFEVDPQLLRSDARLEDLAIDSLGVIEIMFAVEEEFGITVRHAPRETQASLATLGDLARYVDRLVAEQHATKPAEAPLP